MALTPTQPVIRDRDYILPFGKYKGTSVGDVLELNPGYLLWAVENIEWFDLHADILEEAEEVMDDNEAEKEFDRRVNGMYPDRNNWRN